MNVEATKPKPAATDYLPGIEEDLEFLEAVALEERELAACLALEDADEDGS